MWCLHAIFAAELEDRMENLYRHVVFCDLIETDHVTIKEENKNIC